ncbi:MAG: hypothetical protein IPM98_07040 [Lewinellaceae bacterium]|nr:hypothetical protein [Lewinellaceae bacterium]
MGAIGLSSKGFKIGNGIFGNHGSKMGSIKQIVHDGDTVNTRLTDNIGVRFLGIDSAEVSIPLPGAGFVYLKNPDWEAFFTSGKWRTGLKVNPDLLQNLQERIGDGNDVAPNHARHADHAQKSLEAIMQEDMDKSGKAASDFVLFMAFGHEFLDGTGRLLCYLNSDGKNFDDPAVAKAVAKHSYNERQLASGAAMPYFIWPNIQPFLLGSPFAPENIRPETFWKTVQRSSKLKSARKSVQDARKAGKGVFDPQDPLRLEPFELRFISRRKPPTRFIIDLAQPGSNRLLAPQLYYAIPNPEDRLFIPGEYRMLFEHLGWVVEGV